jgi:hypothetical protein
MLDYWLIAFYINTILLLGWFAVLKAGFRSVETQTLFAHRSIPFVGGLTFISALAVLYVTFCLTPWGFRFYEPGLSQALFVLLFPLHKTSWAFMPALLVIGSISLRNCEPSKRDGVYKWGRWMFLVGGILWSTVFLLVFAFLNFYPHVRAE